MRLVRLLTAFLAAAILSLSHAGLAANSLRLLTEDAPAAFSAAPAAVAVGGGREAQVQPRETARAGRGGISDAEAQNRGGDPGAASGSVHAVPLSCLRAAIAGAPAEVGCPFYTGFNFRSRAPPLVS